MIKYNFLERIEYLKMKSFIIIDIFKNNLII
jgi:hypothetical protein